MVLSNNPGRVKKGKGYRAVNWMDCSAAIRDVDGIYPGSSYGRSQQPLLLALRLILVVDRAADYVIYGRPRFKQELCACHYSFNRESGLNSVDRLPNISPKVAGPD